MFLNEGVILSLASDGANSDQATKYLESVKNDQQLITKVKDFLGNLKSNQDLQHELEELKTIRYQQAHLLAQKELTKTFIAIKSVNNLLKKVQPASKDDIPFLPLIECIKAYKNADIDYVGVMNSIPNDMEPTPEVTKTNEKLRIAMEDLKAIHANAHRKIRDVIITYSVKFIESNDLPIKK